ncbi:diguanylate cyclase [Planctomycetota bacterium]|nr:diguanylate cyclase [Planctomycetota bacterium]
MLRLFKLQTLTARLFATLIIIGIVLATAIHAILLYRNHQYQQRFASTQINEALQTTLQNLSRQLQTPTPADILLALNDAFTHSSIVAVRLTNPDGNITDIGNWNQLDREPIDHLITRPLQTKPNHNDVIDQSMLISLEKKTTIVQPFDISGETWTLSFRVDAAKMWASQRAGRISLYAILSTCSLIFTVTVLVFIRRWFIHPLKQINKLINQHAPAVTFNRLAKQNNNEIGQLAKHIEDLQTHHDLQTKELQNIASTSTALYTNAPAALISIDLQGIITHANQRADQMLNPSKDQPLIDQNSYNYIDPRDKPKLQETLERLTWQESCRCDIRLLLDSGNVKLDAAIDASGIHDDLGNLTAARLSIIDMSSTTVLHQKLESKTRLMNMVVDHMSDGILLVDQSNKIAAVNQRICQLLHSSPEQLQGTTCDHASLWDRLGIFEHDKFLQQLIRIEADDQRPTQENIKSTHGSFTFQGIPIRDGLGELQGRLWVISESTNQENDNRLANQQNQRLATIKHFADEIAKASTTSQLLEITVKQLHDFFNVEAVGIAIRDNKPHKRSQQLLYRNDRHCELDSERKLIRAIETGLMPEIFASPDFAYWPDLDISKGFWLNDRHRSSWRRTFTNCNFTSLAVGPLIDNSQTTQGFVWCAQRAGERFERHEMLMIELITPLIEARLELVQLKESLKAINLIDPVTSLPSQQQFLYAAEHVRHSTNNAWSLLMLDVDYLDRVTDQMGHDSSDHLLQSISSILQAIIRRNCFVARYKHSSFAIIIPDNDRENIYNLAERLRDRLATTTHQLADDQSVATSCSIGIAFSDIDGPEIAQILAIVETRTQSARTHGRNCIVDSNGLLDSVAS